MAKQRYFSEDDPDKGVPRSQLKRLSKAKQLAYMTYWFHSNFEDPVHRTSYASSEGGYLWNHGGPYDANDELYAEFGGLLPDKRIEEAQEEVESDGITEWAPGNDHPDTKAEYEEATSEERIPNDDSTFSFAAIVEALERGATAAYGSTTEQDARKEISKHLQQLRQTLPPASPGIGHNNPPSDGAISEESLPAIAREATAAIEHELSRPQPNALEVARAASKLEKLWDWTKKRLDDVAAGAAKAVGAAIVAVGVSHIPAIKAALETSVHALANWLSLVVPVQF